MDQEDADAEFQERMEALEPQFRVDLRRYFTVIQTIGGGGCLYQAIALGIGRRQTDQVAIRLEIADYLEEHQHDFVEFIDEDHTIEDEIETIRDIRQWGNNFGIRVASMLFQRPIYVIQAPMQVTPFEVENPLGAPIFISYHNGNHYNFLRPRVDDPVQLIREDQLMDTSSQGNPPSDNSPDQESLGQSNNRTNNENVLYSQEIGQDGEDQRRVSFKDAFTAAKWDMRGRCHAMLMMLIPKIDEQDYGSAMEMIEETKPNHIYLMVDYWGSHSKQLLKNTYAKREYKVFQIKLVIPEKEEDQKWGVWMSGVIVTHIILGAMSFAWRGITIFPLFLYSSQSLPVCLLNYVWPSMRRSILRDIQEIMNTPDNFLCLHCPEDCPFKRKYWHVDAAYFLPVQFEVAVVNDFFQRYNVFQSTNEPDVDVIAQIWTIYLQGMNEDQPDLLPRITSAFDDNSDVQKLNFWCSYLILIIDGTTMHPHRFTPVKDLIEDQRLRKVIYSGCAKNADCRPSHFTDPNSPIYKSLSTTSRMFWIRRFQTNNFQEARTDEGKVIELLKRYLDRYWRTTDDPPFGLLNRNSSCMHVLGQAGWDEIQNFVDGGYRIYENQPLPRHFVENRNRQCEGFFSGNYTLHEMVIPVGAFYHRNFNQVQNHVDKVVMTRKL